MAINTRNKSLGLTSFRTKKQKRVTGFDWFAVISAFSLYVSATFKAYFCFLVEIAQKA